MNWRRSQTRNTQKEHRCSGKTARTSATAWLTRDPLFGPERGASGVPNKWGPGQNFQVNNVSSANFDQFQSSPVMTAVQTTPWKKAGGVPFGKANGVGLPCLEWSRKSLLWNGSLGVWHSPCFQPDLNRGMAAWPTEKWTKCLFGFMCPLTPAVPHCGRHVLGSVSPPPE